MNETESNEAQAVEIQQKCGGSIVSAHWFASRTKSQRRHPWLRAHWGLKGGVRRSRRVRQCVGRWGTAGRVPGTHCSPGCDVGRRQHMLGLVPGPRVDNYPGRVERLEGQREARWGTVQTAKCCANASCYYYYDINILAFKLQGQHTYYQLV